MEGIAENNRKYKKNWEKADFKDIKEALQENVTTTGPDGESNDQIWGNIRNSSKSFKRVDLNFLAAYTRLTLANFLSHICVAKLNECRLCHTAPETQEHLFYGCELIQDLKNILLTDIRRLNRANSKPATTLTYPCLMTHTPKLSYEENELLSIYKQCIWQLRGALYYGPGKMNIRKELKNIYSEKVSRRRNIVKTGVG